MAGDLPAVVRRVFSESGGVYHCSGNNGAAQRSFSGGKRKLEVYDFAGCLRNNGDPV